MESNINIVVIPSEDKRRKKCNCSEKSNDGCRHVYSEDFATATILMVAYLIETLVQIFLIVNCYRSFPQSWSNSNWLWILFIGWLVTSLLVTITSIVWTCKGMDFSGRVCGQLLCYLMHFLLLGFLWRYLKIALAYEKADVEEFFKLRKVQIYIQAFPILILHIAYLISTSEKSHENTAVWMVAGELCSSIISLSLHPLLQQQQHNSHNQQNHQMENCYLIKDSKNLTMEVNVTIRILLLISRVIVLGLLVSLASYWIGLILVVHLMISFIWMILMSKVFNKKNNENYNNESLQWGEMNKFEENFEDKIKLRSLVESSYTLFWDLNLVICDKCMNLGLLSLSLPVLLVLVENVAILIIHLRQTQTTIFLVVTSGTCLLCGWLLLIGLTTWKKMLISSQENYATTAKNDTFQGLPVVDPPPVKISDTLEIYPEINLQETKTNGNNQIPPKELKEDEIRGRTRSPLGINNVVTSSAQELEEMNTSMSSNNYERINETLMTAVKMHENQKKNHFHQALEKKSYSNGLRCKIPTNIFIIQQQSIEEEIESEIECLKSSSKAINGNTMGSTSSRNTNTVTDLTSSSNSNDTASHTECHIFSKNAKPQNNNKEEPYQSSKKMSPLVIRKASKILLNQRQQIKESKQRKNRCNSQNNFYNTEKESSDQKVERASDNNIYEKLIEDAYGILIYEGDSPQKTRFIKSDNFQTRKKLRVLCAKCLGNHDPLLSDCFVASNNNNNNNIQFLEVNNKLCIPLTKNSGEVFFIPRAFDSPNVLSETTEYPTDTEFTCNLQDEDVKSVSTHISTQMHHHANVTYANLPVNNDKKCNFNHIFNSAIFPASEVRKEFTGFEYVRAWLMMNDSLLAKESSAVDKANCLNRNKKSQSNVRQKRLQHRNKPFMRFQPQHFQPPPKHKLHPIMINNPIEEKSSSNKFLSFKDIFNVPNNNNCENSFNKSQIAPHSCQYLISDRFSDINSDLLETVV